MRIYALRLDWRDPETREDVERLLAFLSPEEQERITRLRRQEDRLRGIVGRACVRWLLCTRFSLDNSALQFTANLYGKPYLAKPELKLHYNISHSGAWVTVALSYREVGIDVQLKEPWDIGPFLGCLSAKEADCLAQMEEKDRRDSFYDLWTLKESYVKAAGKGMHEDFRSFTIRRTEAGAVVSPWRPYFFRQYALEEGYSLSVCSQDRSSFPESLSLLRLKELSF